MPLYSIKYDAVSIPLLYEGTLLLLSPFGALELAMVILQKTYEHVHGRSSRTFACIKAVHVLLVGLHIECSAGELSNDDEGAEDCRGAMWYTTARETEHAVTWKTPACCEFGGTNVQIFVTGSKHDDDYLRQQELFVEADQSKCSCAGGVQSTTCMYPHYSRWQERHACKYTHAWFC